MLKQRIITAIALTSLLLGSLLAGKAVLFSLFLGLFVILAAWEWAALVNCRKTHQKALYSLLLVLPLPLLHVYMAAPWPVAIVCLGTAGWCGAALAVYCYQTTARFLPAGGLAGCAAGVMVLVPAWTGLAWLFPRQDGPQFIILFFLTVCMADSMAFLAGRRWGRNKLAGRVSPGKTREGFYAGMAAALLPAIIFAFVKDISAPAGIWLVLLCLASAMFSVIGDLFISMFKRHANVKDSGRLLPGHGGVLDRIDSITAAAPVFATGMWMLEGKL